MFFCLLAIIIGSSAFAGIDTDITPKHQAILKGDWTPTPQQTTKALLAVQKFLINGKKTDKRQAEIRKILANSGMYSVQFSGTLEKGRKIIKCNFFPRTEESYGWKSQRLIVKDGGFWYWRIEYDVDLNECINFSPNGYA